MLLQKRLCSAHAFWIESHPEFEVMIDMIKMEFQLQKGWSG